MSRQRRPRRPQSGSPYKKKWIRGPRFGVRNLDPKTGSDQRSFPTFLGVSACAFNALRRGQTCWSKRSHVTFFDDAHSEATCAPPSQRAQGRPLSARPDFGLDFGPYFWVLPSDSFSQQRAYKLANVSHTLVPKVETIAVCERERVAHVCCAALAQCMPVHAHCGAHACSVPQEERKSQCTICQSCNLKLPRRCQSNTQFCALCRFGR